MRRQLVGLVVAALAVGMAADVTAQGRGGRGGFGGGGGFGVQRGALLRVESVQQELGLEEVQLDDIRAMQQELRGERGDRPNFRDMSDEERSEAFAKMREQAAERQTKENQKLAEILDSDQMNRLNGIFAQVAGAAALQDALIVNELGLSDDQVQDIEQVNADARDEMRSLFGSGDRETMRERMTEIRENTETASLAVLSDDQRSAFDKLKGETFELSDEDRRSMFGGRGGRGGGPGGGGERGRRGRPQLEE